MRVTTLRKIHPIFYRRVLWAALLFTYGGIALSLNVFDFSTRPAYTFLDIFPRGFLALLIAAIGFGLLYTINFSRYLYVRIWLSLGAGFMAMWSMAFLLALFVGIDISPYAWAIYGYIAATLLELATDQLVTGIPLKDKGPRDEHGL